MEAKLVPAQCPECGSERYYQNGSRRRRVMTESGEVEVECYGAICRACGRSESVMPDGVSPSRYTDGFRRAALAELRAHGGNMGRTARAMQTRTGAKITVATIKAWADKNGEPTRGRGRPRLDEDGVV